MGGCLNYYTVYLLLRLQMVQNEDKGASLHLLTNTY